MKRKPTYTSSLGSISSGTMRDEDLIQVFTTELRDLMQRCRVGREDRKRFTALLAAVTAYVPYLTGDPSRAHKAALVDELFDALDAFAPPYAYFGAHEGDGADYGFWPRIDDDELPKLEAGLDHRDHWGDDVYLVNDHGNVSCGRFDKRGRWHEYWSVV